MFRDSSLQSSRTGALHPPHRSDIGARAIQLAEILASALNQPFQPLHHIRLHRGKIGCKLTTLTQERSDYVHVPVDGPYKAEHYRY